MKKIVYILSSSYAGSHYLSLLLGSHSRAKHLGELRKLSLSHGRDSREVQMKTDDIFEGIGPGNIDSAYEFIFERLPSEVECVIDASKRAYGWADRFLGLDEYQRYYIHLIRDPRAMLRRWKQRSHFRKNFRTKRRLVQHNKDLLMDLALAGEDKVLSYRWVMENQRIQSFITENNLNSRIVTYRDLASNPEHEIRRLIEWLGYDYEPEQLEYWNFDHVGTTKRAYADVKSQDQCKIDLRWQSDLPIHSQQYVVQMPHVLKFAEDLGLVIEPDGLRQV